MKGNFKIIVGILSLLSLLEVVGYAASTRSIDADTVKSSDHTKTWTMPSATGTLSTLAGTETLTNKTLSGNIINSFTSSGTVFTNPAADGSAGAALKTDGAGGLSFGAIGVAGGGTGQASLTANSLIVGNGTSAVTFVAPSTSGNVLTSNGTSWTSAAPAAATAVMAPPTFQRFASGSGTYNKDYTFVITSGSATVGATYTNNSVTFTVYATVASATQVVMSGSGAPASSGTLTKASGTGDATLTFSQYLAPKYLHVKGAGGGGGGAGSGTSAGTAATDGGTTTFGSSCLSANGGTHGVFGGSGSIGGSASIGSCGVGAAFTGSPGIGGQSVGASGAQLFGGAGGNTPIFTGGGYSAYGAAGGAAVTNSGGGGGGAGCGALASCFSGTGGASGGAFDAIIPNPSATYSYGVGAAGAAGAAGAGSGAFAGGPAAAGQLNIWEYYQ